MTPQTISLRVGYNDTKLTFHLRVVSLEDENLYSQRLGKLLDDDDHYDKVYRCIVDTLGEWSTEMPTKQTLVDGRIVEKPLGKGTFLEVMRTYFAERTPENERITNAAMVVFRNKMSPDVDFL